MGNNYSKRFLKNSDYIIKITWAYVNLGKVEWAEQLDVGHEHNHYGNSYSKPIILARFRRKALLCNYESVSV